MSLTTPSGRHCVGSSAGAFEAPNASLEGLLEATVGLSAVAHEPEHWEAVLRRLARR
jgi:hypothetical protein